MRIFSIALLVSGIAFGTDLSAATTTYTCKVSPSREGAWISKNMIITHDNVTGAVSVRDSLSMHYTGSPSVGRVEVQNARRISFVWKLANIGRAVDDDLQFTAGFVFRATIKTNSHAVSVTSKPLGYANSFKGNGTCVVR